MIPTFFSCRRRERGFTLVEAIVAGVVLLIVGTAAAGVLVDTVKTQSKLSLNERRMAVAEGVFERLKSETRWMERRAGNCQSMPLGRTQVRCRDAWLNAHYQASDLVNQSGSSVPVRYETQIIVHGIDDAYDGTRQADRDGTRPDYYAAKVSIRRNSSERWFTVEGTIDPPGRVSTGALVIAVCAVTRQYDERLPIAGCPTQSPNELLGFPAGGPRSSDANAAHDWQAALDRAGSGGNWNMVTYGLRPANGVQLHVEQYREPSGAQRDAVPEGWTPPAGCSASADRKRVRCVVSVAAPERNVAGLIPGRYRVTLASIPRGYEHWPLHSVPSDNTALVEKGRRSRVLQVVRPVARDSYDVSLWSCDHSQVQTWGTGPCVNRIEPYGISAWMVPAPSSRAHWTNYASAPRGASRIRFRALAPGLYSARMVTAGRSSLSLHRGNRARGADLRYVWINPVADGIAGGDSPASSGAAWTRHWCDYARRVSYLSGVGLGPGGGNVPHRHYTYTRVRNSDGSYRYVVSGSYIHQHYYYPATSCRSSGGGGGPPGPGSGGA